MIICVMSSHKGQTGNSTASIFIAMSLSLLKKRKVCLTHVNFADMTLKKAFSLSESKDVTTSLTQITKLIETRSIKPDDLISYTVQISSDFYLYSTYQPPLEEKLFQRNYRKLIEYLKESFQDIVIDFDTELDKELFNVCYQLSDVFVITTNQNKKTIENANLLANTLKEMLDDSEKKIFFLVNQYTTQVSSCKSIASMFNIKPKELLTLTQTYYLQRCMNSGTIDDVFRTAVDNNVKTAPVKQDMLRLSKMF